MRTRLLLALAAVAFAAAAQTNSAFDAASVKLNRDPNPRGIAFQLLPSGRVHIVRVPLYVIIALAYDVPFQSVTGRLSGGPDWVRSEIYDIEATGTMPADMNSAMRLRQTKLMLRSLLAERFHLQVRHETKQMPIYSLSVAKTGPKLTPAKVSEADCLAGTVEPPCHQVFGGIGRGLHGKAVTLADIAYYAQSWSDRPLVDRSGLSGLYEVDTDGWVPMETQLPSVGGAPPSGESLAMADPARPTLFVIMNRLGLKMEPATGPVDVYVIEHAEHPAAN